MFEKGVGRWTMVLMMLLVVVAHRPVLVEVTAPRVDPLDLNIFKSCHKDDDRPLMPSMRAK